MPTVVTAFIRMFFLFFFLKLINLEYFFFYKYAFRFLAKNSEASASSPLASIGKRSGERREPGTLVSPDK